jgi:hypothetical protein
MRASRWAWRARLACPESVRDESKTQARWREACGWRLSRAKGRTTGQRPGKESNQRRVVLGSRIPVVPCERQSATGRCSPEENNERQLTRRARNSPTYSEGQNDRATRARRKRRNAANATISMVRRVMGDPVASD